MHIGLTMFPTDYAIQPHELAREAEARGFESLWLPEHSHIPTSRKSPWPGGAELPKYYTESYDPFVSLGAAAVVTKKIKLATGICLVIQRDPIEVLPQFRKMAKDAGRDPASLSFTIFAAPREPELLKRYRDAGVDRVVLMLPPKERDAIVPMLDQSASLVQGR